jgi:hypothetical protein
VIRYRYNIQLSPPAPFVHLALRNPADGTELNGIAAQIDSAADRTVLPESIVQELGLAQVGTLPIGGLGGIVYALPTYVVEIAIHDLAPCAVKIVATANESWILLGRDVINAHRLILDGPGGLLDLE